MRRVCRESGTVRACPAGIPEGVDAVITLTTATEPVYDEPPQVGRIVVGVGAFKPEMAEIGKPRWTAACCTPTTRLAHATGWRLAARWRGVEPRARSGATGARRARPLAGVCLQERRHRRMGLGRRARGPGVAGHRLTSLRHYPTHHADHTHHQHCGSAHRRRAVSHRHLGPAQAARPLHRGAPRVAAGACR